MYKTLSLNSSSNYNLFLSPLLYGNTAGSDAKFSVCACVNLDSVPTLSLSDLLGFFLYLSKSQL